MSAGRYACARSVCPTRWPPCASGSRRGRPWTSSGGPVRGGLFPHEVPYVDKARLEVFVPVRVLSTLNARQHWTVTAWRARRARDGVAAAVLTVLGRAWRFTVPPSRPKRITFAAYVGHPLDDDNLAAAL